MMPHSCHDLRQAVAEGFNLYVRCEACQHEKTFIACTLLTWLDRHGLPTSFPELSQRLVCTFCLTRGPTLRARFTDEWTGPQPLGRRPDIWDRMRRLIKMRIEI